MVTELISELKTHGANFINIVDVYHCNGCLKCLIDCPWTQKYMKSNINK